MLTWIPSAGSAADDATGPDEREGIAVARRERFARYAWFVLYDLEVDADRLAAAARVVHARMAADRSRWGTAGELVDTAIDSLRAVGADLDSTARERLRAELTTENSWNPEPYRQGPWHRFSRPRRVLRRFDPRYWTRRLHARAAVRMVRRTAAGNYQRIAMMLGDTQIGRLDYMICIDCRVGFVGKISIDPEMQGRGLGTRALHLARREASDLRWCTSGQYMTARTFWSSLGRRTGHGYRPADDDLGPCIHMGLSRGTGRRR